MSKLPGAPKRSGIDCRRLLLSRVPSAQSDGLAIQIYEQQEEYLDLLVGPARSCSNFPFESNLLGPSLRIPF